MKLLQQHKHLPSRLWLPRVQRHRLAGFGPQAARCRRFKVNLGNACSPGLGSGSGGSVARSRPLLNVQQHVVPGEGERVWPAGSARVHSRPATASTWVPFSRKSNKLFSLRTSPNHGVFPQLLLHSRLQAQLFHPRFFPPFASSVGFAHVCLTVRPVLVPQNYSINS